MKKFNYKMESILKIRLMQEDQKKAELARVVRLADEKKETITATQQQLQQAMQYSPSGRVDVGDLHRHEDHRSCLKRRIAQLQAELGRIEEHLSKLRQELVACRVESRKFEVHKENSRILWRDDSIKKEQEMFDEINSNRRG